MEYQTFADRPGSSDSSGKWAALRLQPNLLRDARLLDLGCNEGYFCGRAVEAGATDVVGVEQDSSLSALAAERVPQARILNQSWDEPWPGQFDIILMLSAIHYVPDQGEFLKRVADSLLPNGTLVLECGVADIRGSGWQRVTRGDGSTVRYPGWHQLHSLFRKASLSFRRAGGSVPQPGDPVSRHVFHCVKSRRSLVMVTGPPQTGKTNLCEDLGLPYFSVDDFVRRTMVLEKADWTSKEYNPDNLLEFYRDIVSQPEAYRAFWGSLLQSLPDTDMVIADVVANLADGLRAEAEKQGMRVWTVSRE